MLNLKLAYQQRSRSWMCVIRTNAKKQNNKNPPSKTKSGLDDVFLTRLTRILLILQRDLDLVNASWEKKTLYM